MSVRPIVLPNLEPNVTSGPSIFALADDLTGAAEIAAIGHRFGLPSAIVTGTAAISSGTQLVVCDTDSRLIPPEEAAWTVGEATIGPAARTSMALFKKVDSVLRGNVLAEVEAMAAVADRPRVLLVPANPAFGRTIRDGCYFVDGTPIHLTAFAQDPHHPAVSSRVADLLGAPHKLPVQILPPGIELPPSGVIVGEAGSPEDVAYWASRVDAITLPAGGAEFFSAWLRTLGHTVAAAAPERELERPILIVSGTTVPSSRAMLSGLSSIGLPVIPMTESVVRDQDAAAGLCWAENIGRSLATHGLAIALAPARIFTEPGAVEAIRNAFATLVQRLESADAFSHLVIEGGATAAAIVQALQWNELIVTAEWSPGVVTLRPALAPNRRVTLKPGSYPWPESWRADIKRVFHDPTR
jgi:uncharacterized protein YgbK (DUF1537 family)